MWHYYHRADMGIGWALSNLLIFLFWIGLVWLVVSVIIKHHQDHNHPKTHDGEVAPKETPLEIAQTRYARGDISAEEFAKLKKDLS